MGVTINSMADKCAICGKFRRAHSAAGLCPTGKPGKGGAYTAFLDTKFTKAMPESAIAKNKIAVGQVYLDAQGGNHGYIVKDLHQNPTGDFVTVQRMTPMGKDGPITRVSAKTMAEVTHYGPCVTPDWLTLALKSRKNKQ